MEASEFISMIRAAQAAGKTSVKARLKSMVRGVLNAEFVIDGSRNGNKHDIWIQSATGAKKGIGRAYLGSARMETRLEGWNELIDNFKD